MSSLNTEDKIKIKLFGSFSLSCGQSEITGDNLSNQLCNLVGFLIVNRDKQVSQDAIIDALWPDEVSNPAAALKNLVYRFRKLSTELGFPYAKNFIVSSGGSYHINNELSIEVDIESFSDFCAQSEDQNDKLSRAEFLREAVDCYGGDFMSSIGYKTWIVSISQHYHALYFKTVYSLLDIYAQSENFSAMNTVAKKAADLDVFEENAHKYIIYSLYRLGNQQQAINHYSYVSELFYRELDVELSSGTRKLYTEISKASRTSNIDIKTLKAELNETPDDINSAFYCELEVFKQIYRFEARSALRNGSSIFIGLFTLIGGDDDDLDKTARDRAMEHLHLTIRESLRKGDVFARCSPAQYVLMLPMINYENGLMVLNRIDKRFRATFHSRKVAITTSLQPLDPVGWD